MILIGISGKKGSGKDLLASFLARKYGFVNMPFAAELKEAVRRDFNFTKEHTDGVLKENPCFGPEHLSPREIMVEYGQFFRRFDPQWWIKKVFQRIQTANDFMTDLDSVRVTISDVRFQNEANYIKQQGGFLVRLERRQDLNIYKEPSLDLSETDLDNYGGFDFRLPEEMNIGPTDMSAFADHIMAQIPLLLEL